MPERTLRARCHVCRKRALTHTVKMAEKQTQAHTQNFLEATRSRAVQIGSSQSLNGTQLSGHTRKFGDLEAYGVLNRAHDGPASDDAASVAKRSGSVGLEQTVAIDGTGPLRLTSHVRLYAVGAKPVLTQFDSGRSTK